MSGFCSPFGKAFSTPAQGPFSSGPFALCLATKPSLPDGFVVCGEGNGNTVESIAIQPFCDAPQGSLFSMRLFYWNRRGNNPDDVLWIGTPLVEILCSVSNVCGPAFPALGSGHLENNRLCDQLTLTAGNVGFSGEIYSFGAGSDLPAMVNCEIQGAMLLSFDFQAVDPNNPGQAIPGVNMNAYWAKFS